MEKGFFKYFAELPPLAKTIIVIAVILAIIILIVWIRSGIKKARKKAEAGQNFNADYGNAVAQGQKPTYPASNYQIFADKIYEAACSGIFCYGTDEETIQDVFKQMKNDVDILLLIKAFGLREERGTICIPFTDCPGIALGQFLQTELSASEFQKINDILKTQGITFVF
ncbi:MAG: hypothetical protein US53_C0070G0005 [Candidatus Woesebacteria bacterium GW2011_GWA1_37_7]|uniref:Uncharacterized protein n=1 Tax=Candidatus Woesebacteria bacterium GW2011_GWA1_37_7 TaxID=1618545 RepID=A0A0G0K589_9BACT|nr:MAG: hypothetical protein US53_C0070G0005 [Candidatus Woesebacteria bacterium GW2011_GWA1_37_7]